MNPSETDSFLSNFKTEINGKDCPAFLKNSRIAEMYVGMGRVVQALDFFENAVVCDLVHEIWYYFIGYHCIVF